MKKFLPAILIVTILANIFVPFSVGINKNNIPVIRKSITEAAVIELNTEVFVNDVEATVEVEVNWPEISTYTDNTKRGVAVEFLDQSKSRVAWGKLDNPRIGSPNLDYVKTSGSVVYSKFKPDTNYIVLTQAFQTKDDWETIYKDAGGVISKIAEDPRVTNSSTLKENEIKTLAEGVKTKVKETVTAGVISSMPPCSMNPFSSSDGTFMGCIAQGIYYLFFSTTSWIFGFAGKFFDYTFYYSVSDDSYRTPFVLEGWAMVRDFCNIFFIFVLLYVAISTILNVHGFKTKEMIINVVIIGLMINFSLFAANLIVDSSNIVARIFYNPNIITIGTKKDANNKIISQPGPSGELQLSAALINKVDPQDLIINSAKVNPSDAKSQGAANQNQQDVGVGSFILIVFLATAVNIVGIIVFLSVGLIFISRVVGIWIYMILAPLAFFSYTVPSMQGMDMVGWKKWWPELLKLSFLAPIFIFFLYLIIKFLNTGLDLVGAAGKEGINFVVSIMVPFAFIMILLLKAKSIAKDMSGKLGQQITGGVAAVGSLALGGAALAKGFAFRNTVGAFMKGASTGDTAAERDRTGTSRGRFDKFKGRLANITGIGAAQRAVGVKLNQNQHEIEHASHARHDLDTAANIVAPGKKWKELNGEQRLQARTNMERIVEMRNMNLGNKTWAQISDAQRANVTAAIAPRLASNTTAGDRTIADARRKVGLREKLVQSTIGGSGDIRDLSKLIAGEQDKALSKFLTGTTSLLAGGMRNMFKQSGLNYGAGQKDFLKDLGHTITEALKSTQVKVDLSHVGEEKKEDGHGGGGHH